LDQGVPSIEQVTFNPPFTNHLYFVYKKKQSSKNAIAAYEVNKKNSFKTISNNNALTAQVLEANTIQSFSTALQKNITMSILLETATIKESLFPDFDGIIKVFAWVAIL
jgi:hypothetical protein